MVTAAANIVIRLGENVANEVIVKLSLLNFLYTDNFTHKAQQPILTFSFYCYKHLVFISKADAFFLF